jgi:hypothetical protein
MTTGVMHKAVEAQACGRAALAAAARALNVAANEPHAVAVGADSRVQGTASPRTYQVAPARTGNALNTVITEP